MNLYMYEIDQLLVSQEQDAWARIECSRYVRAAPPTIRAILFDLDQYGRLFGGVTETRHDGVFPDPGGKLDLIYAAAGFKFQVSVAVISAGPYQAVVRFEARNSQLESERIAVRGYGIWRFAPQDGGSRVSAIFLYELPASALARQMEQQVIRQHNRANLERSLDNLRALAEGRPN